MDAKNLTVADMEDVSEAILTLVASYPELPQGTRIQWQSMDDKQCIGLFTMTGAIYLKQYVSGAFKGQLPFRIMFQTSPTTNKGRLNSQRFLNALGEWLEGCAATFKNEKLTLESIKRTSSAFQTAVYEDGSEVYQITLNTIYYVKK